MNKVCTIQSKTQTKNALGQVTNVYANVSTAVPCRVMPLNASYSDNDAKMRRSPAGWKIYIPGTYSVDENYRIIVAGDQNYIVKFAKQESSFHHWELECEAETILQ